MGLEYFVPAVFVELGVEFYEEFVEGESRGEGEFEVLQAALLHSEVSELRGGASLFYMISYC